MFSQAKNIASTVSAKLHLGAQNLNPSPLLNDKLHFIRSCVETLLMSAIYKARFPVKQTIHRIILLAIFAEFHATGNCMEHAALALLEAWKLRINIPTEIIVVEGKRQDNKNDNHAFLLLNRHSMVDVRCFATWHNVVIVDAWQSLPIIKATSLVHPKISKEYLEEKYLVGGFLKKINDVHSVIRQSKNLSHQQWFDLVDLTSVVIEFLLKNNSSKELINLDGLILFLKKKQQEFITLGAQSIPVTKSRNTWFNRKEGSNAIVVATSKLAATPSPQLKCA